MPSNISLISRYANYFQATEDDHKERWLMLALHREVAMPFVKADNHISPQVTFDHEQLIKHVMPKWRIYILLLGG